MAQLLFFALKGSKLFIIIYMGKCDNDGFFGNCCAQPVTWKFLFCFDLILVLRPGKQFFSHVETEPPIPGYYQYLWE